MGVWVKCNERMLEVTSFKINDKEVLKENGMFMLEKEVSFYIQLMLKLLWLIMRAKDMHI